MFIPTINTGGREAPFSTPLGREAKSLMGYPLSFYEGVQKNKQTNFAAYASLMMKMHLGSPLPPRGALRGPKGAPGVTPIVSQKKKMLLINVVAYVLAMTKMHFESSPNPLGRPPA